MCIVDVCYYSLHRNVGLGLDCISFSDLQGHFYLATMFSMLVRLLPILEVNESTLILVQNFFYQSTSGCRSYKVVVNWREVILAFKAGNLTNVSLELLI